MTSPQILICHNEAAARAAADILDMDTADATAVDWSALQGHRLILWPANTPISILAVQVSARKASAAGAASIKVIQPGPLAQSGWDASAAQVDGWDRDALLDWLRSRAVTWAPPAADEPSPDDYGAPLRPSPDVQTEAELAGQTRPSDPVLPAPHHASAFDPAASLHDRWAMLGLDTTKTGPVANEDNVLRVLERHPDLAHMLWFDEFLGRIMTNGPKAPREWSDADDVRLTASLQRDMSMTRTKVSHVRAAVIGHAFARVRNCAQDWLNGLEWDQEPRLQAFFSEAFGAPDTPYTRAVGRNFWVSLAARVMRPGCKVDNMVVLEGGQGAGKSSALRALASHHSRDGAWYTVQHESITGKGFFEVLQGKMLVEIAEMDAFGKAEVTRVKQVVSTETDRYRESYGRYAKDHPRHSIFVGTTNKDDWNRDETGARRFWPIRCAGKVDLAYIERHRAQLFAEAVAAYRAGTKWWEMPDVETQAEQDGRREEETWEEPVRDWLNDPYKSSVSIREVLWSAVQVKIGEQQRREINRMTAVLHRIGWKKRHTAKGNMWFRPENEPSTGSA